MPFLAFLLATSLSLADLQARAATGEPAAEHELAQGYMEAYTNLGLVEGDLALIKQAAEHYTLGSYQPLMHCYEDQENWEEAYFWGLVALYGGDSELIPARAHVPPDRRQAIQARADAWLAQRQRRWDATIDGPHPDP
jgi:hypothetical protein